MLSRRWLDHLLEHAFCTITADKLHHQSKCKSWVRATPASCKEHVAYHREQLTGAREQAAGTEGTGAGGVPQRPRHCVPALSFEHVVDFSTARTGEIARADDVIACWHADKLLMTYTHVCLYE